MPRNGRRAAAAFTLLELMVVVSIVAVALGIVSLAFRRLADTNRLTVAAGLLTQYASVARAYAVEHGVETLLVVNNANGRLELWHANPPLLGGPWDPLSAAVPNGFVPAPVLDSTAALPLDGAGRPLVIVLPIDFDAVTDAGGARLRAVSDNQASYDNLAWPMLCFDSTGLMVTRMRRIATRLPADYLGNAVATPNRRVSGEPDVAASGYQVNATDSLITSTPGFVVSDRGKVEDVFAALGANPPRPADIVEWLRRCRSFPEAVRFVFVNPHSGREWAAAE